jgi:tetratricopeptide (TPR) repeat protein
MLVNRLAIVALLALAGAGCARDWSDPGAVLLRYLEAVSRDDLDEAYAHLSVDDRDFRTREEYVALESNQDSVIVRELARRTRFELVALEVSGERALARVRVTAPDMAQAIGLALEQGLTGARAFDSVADDVLGRELPVVQSTKGFGLVREPDGWRVRLGWRHQDEIHSYLTAAQALENAGQPAEALEVYRRALALDDALLDVRRRIAELEGGSAEAEEPEIERAEGDARSPVRRARRNRELLRELARQDLEGQGASAEVIESAERVPFDEGR